MRIIGLLLIAMALVSSCEVVENKNTAIDKSHAALPAVLTNGLNAHGGIQRWDEMKALTFTCTKDQKAELQQISLKDRKTLISRDSVQVGYDGKEVWVAPNKAAFGKSSARFYHNLIFYFYAMPFVLADEGIIYEQVPNRELEGVSYPGIKISYKANVGDAPDDHYIAYFHPKTNELYLLLYTVTYYNGGPNDKFKALVYESWQEVNGIKLPMKLVGYQFANDQLGDKRYERIFSNVKLSKEAFKEDLFKMPKEAEIDVLIKH